MVLLLASAAAFTGCNSSREQPAGRFALSSDEATPNASRLFVIRADGRDERMATPELTRVGESDPDWSPDATRIVFDRSYDCAVFTGCDALWIVTADGRAERRLTPEHPHGVTSELSPTWSPDGRRIAYEFLNDRSGASDIWVMNSDGSGTRRLTHVGDAEEPAWSPDGRRIAFSHAGDIFVLELASSSLRRLTRTPVDESYPDWSPDGERIAYEVNDDGDYHASVMDADGTNLRRLSPRGENDGHPVWSPGGRFIAYTSDGLPVRGEGLAIVIVEADSGRRVRRIDPAGMDLYPIDWTGG